MVLTRIKVQHFASANIVYVACGFSHSTAVTD